MHSPLYYIAFAAALKSVKQWRSQFNKTQKDLKDNKFPKRKHNK